MLYLAASHAHYCITPWFLFPLFTHNGDHHCMQHYTRRPFIFFFVFVFYVFINIHFGELV